jgi:phospholipid/cholesterol/gamma-HCH transport system substrate-binding protein
VVEDTIVPALNSIKSQIETIETLLGSGEDQGQNKERLAGAFESLAKLSASLEQSIDPHKIAAIVAATERMTAQLAEVSSRFTGTNQEIRTAVKQYGELAQEIRGVVSANGPGLQSTMDDTQRLLQELSSALTPILANIEDATRDLSALSRELRQNPAAILKGRTVEERTPWFK